jgi:hypothetical protein
VKKKGKKWKGNKKQTKKREKAIKKVKHKTEKGRIKRKN